MEAAEEPGDSSSGAEVRRARPSHEDGKIIWKLLEAQRSQLKDALKEEYVGVLNDSLVSLRIGTCGGWRDSY